MINEEVRIRWTGLARYNPEQAEWAVAIARHFAVNDAPDRKHTGARRGVVWTGGELREGQAALVYFTKAGAVVVRIHEEEGS